LIRANDAFARITSVAGDDDAARLLQGISSNRVLGRHAVRVRRAVRQVLEKGEPVVDQQMTASVGRAPGSHPDPAADVQRHVSISYFPICEAPSTPGRLEAERGAVRAVLIAVNE